MATLSIQLAASTDTGLRRTGNEDTFGVFDIPGGEAAFVVCDGMGGLQAGDLAANEAVRVIEATLRELLPTHPRPSEVLLEALRRANDAVNALARPGMPLSEDPTVDEREAAASSAFMGTTAVAGVVREGVLHLAHAGDSRGYRLRGGTLERLTDDHSFVAEQVKLGNLTDAEARVSRFRNMITCAIGIDKTIQPDVRQETLLEKDVILVCTDGLTTMLEDEEIAAVLSSGGDLERRVRALIDAANRKGGHDNVTVLLLGVGESGVAPVRPMEKRGGGVPDPELQRARETGAPLPGTKRRRSESSKGGSGFPVMAMLAILGGLSILGALGLALSEDLRTSVGEQLLKTRPPAATAPLVNYAELTYDAKPTWVVDTPLARRSPLALLDEGTVAYLTNTEANVVRIRGLQAPVVLVNNIKVPDRQSPPAEPRDDEVYLAGDPQGNTYVSFSRRGVIKKFSASGKELTSISQLNQPGDLVIDSKNGDIYFIDGTNHVLVLRAHAKPESPKK